MIILMEKVRGARKEVDLQCHLGHLVVVLRIPYKLTISWEMMKT